MVGKVWSLVSLYVFVPFYLKLLGVESYGVITFYNVLITLLYFADAGLSATINRQMATPSPVEQKRNLLRSVEVCYLFVTFFLFLLIFSLSPIIATKFLHTEVVSFNQKVTFIKCMSAAIAFHFYSMLYIGGLLGLEQQTKANIYVIIWSLVKNGLILVPLMYYPSLTLFFLAQCFINFCFCLYVRRSLWSQLPSNIPATISILQLKPLVPFAVGMMIMAFIGAANSQIDKMIVSSKLTLLEFSVYSLVSMLAQIPVLAVIPITQALFPRLVKDANLLETDNFNSSVFLLTKVVALVSAALGGFVFLTADTLLLVLSSNNLVAVMGAPILKLLVLGNVALACQYVPYNIALAKADVKLNLIVGSMSVIFSTVLTVWCVGKYGFSGTPYAWVLLNIIAFFIVNALLLKKLTNISIQDWFIGSNIKYFIFFTILVVLSSSTKAIFEKSALFYFLTDLLFISVGLSIGFIKLFRNDIKAKISL